MLSRQEDQQILGSQAAGITSSNCNSNRLVLELAKKEDRPATGTGLSVSSPILQVDGEIEEEITKYSFESSYHDDDIMEALEEIFLATEVNLTVESRTNPEVQKTSMW